MSEAFSLQRFLATLPGLLNVTDATLRKRFADLSICRLPPGQPFFPIGRWACILEGALDLLQFDVHFEGTPDEAGAPRPAEEDPLRLPPSLLGLPELRYLGRLAERECLFPGGGDSLGPSGGSHLSNVTCLAQVFFRGGEEFGESW